MKNWWIVLAVLAMGCSSGDQLHKFGGNTMGTTYHVVYSGSEVADLQRGVDSVLQAVNQSLSTYIPNSTISILNQSEKGALVDEPFIDNYIKAVEVWRKTLGAFDPTVGPLVNAWGFGFNKMSGGIDSALIDSLMQFVGFEKVWLDAETGFMHKAAPGVMVDFSAIAKGYGVDRVALYLEERGVKNYIVEIGGELRSAGEKAPGFKWIAGVEKPIEDQSGTARELQLALQLHYKSMATSGNYRNFYIKDGRKYAHTIHPLSGYPAESDLLSATVLANTCMTADAYATAFMVIGYEQAKALVDSLESIEAVLLYSDAQGQLQQYVSPGLVGSIVGKDAKAVRDSN